MTPQRSVLKQLLELKHEHLNKFVLIMIKHLEFYMYVLF